MRITDIVERTVPISRYADKAIPSGGLTTSLVAVVTDVARNGVPIVGYGFSSVGRFAQGGLIRERFAPRLMTASHNWLLNDDHTNLDPFRAWNVMMAGEKSGGHGERCVAVGTLDMALWDAAAKIEGLPLAHFLAARTGRTVPAAATIEVYAGGGYPYPEGDAKRLADEIRAILDLGFTRFKMKVGSLPLSEDLKRIETGMRLLEGRRLAVDAMNSYVGPAALLAAEAFAPSGLWWLEDICDPLDFETQQLVARNYNGPIAAGEALFSWNEARLLDQHAGLRRDKDILVFDPTHCYGIPGYLKIVETMEALGWPRTAFWPHGGHLCAHHLVLALGLGGAEVNPLSFQPFTGVGDGTKIESGIATVPGIPGIGFESREELHRVFRSLTQ